MAATNTLLKVVSISQNFLRNAPLTKVGGNPIEPAASIGDWVRGFVLQPPFAWRWNRATVQAAIDTTTGQNVTKALSDFGWLESASISDSTTTWALEVSLNTPEDQSPSRPRFISARLDNDSGNITFRVIPTPDKSYTLNITYQKASPSFSTLLDTWSPIPDYMYHVYSTGYLAKVYEYADDARFIPTFQLFLRSLLSFSEGLTESQKAIFFQDFANVSRYEQTSGLANQLAIQGRSGY